MVVYEGVGPRDPGVIHQLYASTRFTAGSSYRVMFNQSRVYRFGRQSLVMSRGSRYAWIDEMNVE